MSEREKRDGAIRIFEALSGVDEKYLEACEQEQRTGAAVPFGRSASFNRRYGKFVAAALIFCVVGAGYFGLNSLRMGNDSAAGPAMKTDYAAGNQGVREEAAAVTSKYTSEAASESEQADEMRDYSGTMNSANSGDATNSIAASAQEDGRDQRAGSQDEALKQDLHAYMPKDWPQGCIVEVVEESSGTGVLTVHGSYQDSEKEFFLRIIDSGAKQSGEEERTFYEADSVTLADVEKELTDGSGAFQVRYQADGSAVLVQFSGDGDAREIWEMFDSILQ